MRAVLLDCGFHALKERFWLLKIVQKRNAQNNFKSIQKKFEYTDKYKNIAQSQEYFAQTHVCNI